jgi:hypothetical protein
MIRIFLTLALILTFTACGSKGTKVIKPKTHKVWARGNKYLIDIPVGARRIQLFERRKTKTVNMK